MGNSDSTLHPLLRCSPADESTAETAQPLLGGFLLDYGTPDGTALVATAPVWDNEQGLGYLSGLQDEVDISLHRALFDACAFPFPPATAQDVERGVVRFRACLSLLYESRRYLRSTLHFSVYVFQSYASACPVVQS